jgi:type III secretion system TyeA family effector delivery regulator
MMSQGIDRVGLSPLPATQYPRDVASEAVGDRRGDKVVLKTTSQASLVEQSLEELPAHLSEKTSKKLAERTARSRSASRVGQIAEKYVQGKDKAELEKYERAASALKKLGKPTPDQLRQLLKDSFGDQHSTALLFLEEAFSTDEADADLLATIRQVKAEIGTGLQTFVREELAAFETLGEVYTSLVGGRSTDDFMSAAEMMIKKLGSDLQAHSGSAEIAQLKSTVDSLYHLELARNTFLAFSELTTRMGKSFGEKWQDGSHRLMRDLLPLKDQRFLDGPKVRGTVDKLGIAAMDAKIYLLRELYVVFSKLPDKAYPDHESRLKVTGAVQEALDTAINEEET